MADARLAIVMRGIKEHFERGLQEYGLHAGQQFILQHLWREDGLTPGALAARIGIEVPTVVRTVQRMEAAGFVGRERDIKDARTVRVSLTEQGKALENVLPEVLRRLTDEVYAGFSDQERREFDGMLHRLAANVGEAM